MSSLMPGSSLTNSTKSDARNVPCSRGGDSFNASARNSSTGRSGVILKLTCCALPICNNNRTHHTRLIRSIFPQFRLRFLSWFVDLQVAMSLNVFDGLHNPTGPTNLDRLSSGSRTQAEVETLVTRGEIAAAGGHRGPSRSIGGGDLHHCSDCIAVALVTGQAESEPMVAGFGVVHEDMGGAPVFGDYGVHQPVIIDIARSHAAAYPAFAEYVTRDG